MKSEKKDLSLTQLLPQFYNDYMVKNLLIEKFISKVIGIFPESPKNLISKISPPLFCEK